jgi:hypothetical protein
MRSWTGYFYVSKFIKAIAVLIFIHCFILFSNVLILLYFFPITDCRTYTFFFFLLYYCCMGKLFFLSTGDWIPVLMFARQVLYHLSHVPTRTYTFNHGYPCFRTTFIFGNSFPPPCIQWMSVPIYTHINRDGNAVYLIVLVFWP